MQPGMQGRAEQVVKFKTSKQTTYSNTTSHRRSMAGTNVNGMSIFIYCMLHAVVLHKSGLCDVQRMGLVDVNTLNSG